MVIVSPEFAQPRMDKRVTIRMTSVSDGDRFEPDDMPQHPSERWNAASGYLVIMLGIAGAAFERGSPPLTAPI
jgi:hypothetical protein